MHGFVHACIVEVWSHTGPLLVFGSSISIHLPFRLIHLLISDSQLTKCLQHLQGFIVTQFKSQQRLMEEKLLKLKLLKLLKKKIVYR